MTYDSFVTAAIAHEAQALVGAFVDHIAQPTERDLCITFYAGRGKIRMVVNKPALAKRALRKARVRFVEEVAFAKRLTNKPGALARVADRLARGGVNIKAAYATTAVRGGATVVFTVSNPAKARRIIG